MSVPSAFDMSVRCENGLSIITVGGRDVPISDFWLWEPGAMWPYANYAGRKRVNSFEEAVIIGDLMGVVVVKGEDFEKGMNLVLT